MFVLGFSTVFVALGASASLIGGLIRAWSAELSIVAGIVIIIMGLHFLGLTRIGLLMREGRMQMPKPVGLWGAYAMGLAFAFGWTPCIGPVLGSVLAIAAGQGEVLRGGLLLACYAAGLTLPLLATAVLFGRVGPALRWVRLRGRLLTRVSAVVMFGYGLMLAADQLAWLTRVLQSGVTSAG
jgi:cytochrome c-type biogenesis protein